MLPNPRWTLLDQVHSELSLRQLSRREGLALATISLCALFLLAALQYGRVFFGDEIGTLRYLKKISAYILTHFSTWLSMNYFILVERWFCLALWSDGLAADYTADDSSRCNNSVDCFGRPQFTGSSRTALIAASLAAFNPYLLMWGPAIRAYSLLVAFSLLAINEFFHWYWQRDWWSGVRCAGAVLLLYLHISMAFTRSPFSYYC